ncbi:MAG TPA: hypothetical protein VJ302_05280 [Blastocatellia bacterium]|nr:hypothetical protein [Blastocatellia bacterium]
MNLTKYSNLLLIAWLLFISIPAAVRGADEKPVPNQRLTRLYSELQTLFRHYYPNATSRLQNGEIHFEHNTRIYMIHHRTRRGEWTDASEEQGPKRGGILCDISLQKGEYQGPLVYPQTFDERYFKVLRMAPYLPKHDVRLEVRLSYPEDVNEDFLEKFTKLIDDFPKYID